MTILISLTSQIEWVPSSCQSPSFISVTQCLSEAPSASSSCDQLAGLASEPEPGTCDQPPAPEAPGPDHRSRDTPGCCETCEGGAGCFYLISDQF